jgi:hypothetical protein
MSRWSTAKWTAALVGLFIVTRCCYVLAGVSFDIEPLNYYWQIIDPKLLKSDLWRSIFYVREQMPGFNLFLGFGIHLFGHHLAAGFHVIYLFAGLTLATALFHLLLRLRVRIAVAFLIAAIFTANPATVLYENLLFYEYPLAMLFCVAALFLHRYLSDHHFIDGLVFFTCLMLIGYLRVSYHLVWMFTAIGFVIWVSRPYWRTTIRCCLVPATLLALPYLKNEILFGTVAAGNDFFGGTDMLMLAANGVSQSTLMRLREQGKISRAFFIQDNAAALEALVPPPPPTGIPVLDQRIKSTGAMNNLGLWKAAVGRLFRKDGIAIFREHPSAIFRSVFRNCRRYPRLADDGFPFDKRFAQENLVHLARIIATYHFLVGGYLFGKPVGLYIVVPILLTFGGAISYRTFSQLARRNCVQPEDATMLFSYANLLSLSLVLILYACGDQNRYMFEMSPFMAALLGTFIEWFMAKPELSRVTLPLATVT